VYFLSIKPANGLPNAYYLWEAIRITLWGIGISRANLIHKGGFSL